MYGESTPPKNKGKKEKKRKKTRGNFRPVRQDKAIRIKISFLLFSITLFYFSFWRKCNKLNYTGKIQIAPYSIQNM